MKKVLFKLIAASLLIATPAKADMWYYIGFPLVLFNDNLALKALSRSCANGDFRGCLQAGYALERQARPEKAIEVYMRACARYSEINCLALGNFYRQHNFLDEAQKIYKFACSLDSGKACHNFFELSKGSLNIEEQLRILLRSCNLNNGLSCFKLGQNLKEIHKPFDQYLKKACLLDVESACEEYRELIGGGNIQAVSNKLSSYWDKIRNFFY